MNKNKTYVHHITPYMSGDIVGGINKAIEHLPEDSIICLRDADTLFLLPNQQEQIDTIANLYIKTGVYDVISCKTNRLSNRQSHQLYSEKRSEDINIIHHMEIAAECQRKYCMSIKGVEKGKILAGLFLLFKKSLLTEIPMLNKSTQFDIIWSKELHNKNKKLGVAEGLYLWHTYRLGSVDPEKAIGHLLKAQDFNLIVKVGEN